MVVVGPDRVLFAKNSDRDGNEAQLLDWQQRRSHRPDSRVTCTWIEIDQVADTNAVLLSRPYWMFGAEMGANEHGVVIGNEAVFTRAATQPTGLTGMDLIRLALERAGSASEAVSVITELLERHGQGGGCGHEHRDFSYDNSFLVADHREAFVLETAGREWAVEHVTSGVRSISNGLTIPEFAEGRQQRIRTHFSRSRIRRACTEAAAAQATTVHDLMTVLRDHGAPAPRYSLLTGAMGAPCMHAGGLAAASQTTASWVAELTPTGANHWVTATAAPCTGLFKPVRIDQPLDLGPDPTDRFDPTCLWWRHELLHRRCLADPERLMPRFAAERDEIERRWLADPPEPADAFAEADRLLERWTEGVWAIEAGDTRPVWVRRYWDARNRRAAMPSGPVRAVEDAVDEAS
jgi:dipeptidase